MITVASNTQEYIYIYMNIYMYTITDGLLAYRGSYNNTRVTSHLSITSWD